MNIKTGIGILFGVPTIFLVLLYYHFGIHNYWQLFLFVFMIVIAYLPGMLLLQLTYTYHIKNKVRREFGD